MTTFEVTIHWFTFIVGLSFGVTLGMIGMLIAMIWVDKETKEKNARE